MIPPPSIVAGFNDIATQVVAISLPTNENKSFLSKIDTGTRVTCTVPVYSSYVYSSVPDHRHFGEDLDADTDPALFVTDL
jgi:hypothetical protein